MERELINTKTAVELLGVSPRTFARLKRAGYIHEVGHHPVLKRSSVAYFYRDEIERMAREGLPDIPEPPQTPPAQQHRTVRYDTAPVYQMIAED